MPSTPDRAQSVASTSSPSRRFLNLLASPFGSKPRNIPEFEVRLKDPHKQYSPGDSVLGSVFLRVTKPTRVTHIVVKLHGYCQVYKNPGSPGDGYRQHASYLSTHRGSRSGEYFGNGFASLFEDEQVLCGDGRLAEGAYQFNFDLEFPDRDLPSSIEFERGTICYLATAIMTRPTTMSPILTDHRKVYFVERIDIAPLLAPKPRTVILAPAARRRRAKAQARKLVDPADKRSRKGESPPQGSETHRPSDASSAPESSQADGDPSASGDPSELSFESSGSSQEILTRLGTYTLASPTPSEAAMTRISTSRTSLVQKVIHATVESQAGGCLRGDTIPMKINVHHTKQVKSVNGVIITLYRMSRVDMRPSIPLGPTEKGKDPKYEDYYPRSVTGLGGLSLSGAGSSHVFRKDLSQTLHPLYINPDTLSTEIHTKIRVPEEVFPTISTVPGQMISFKYYIEVVIDVQGRLGSSNPMTSGLPGSTPLPFQTFTMDSTDMERSAYTPFGSTIIDTTHIRRDKGVVDVDFEVIIGTWNSEKKGKRKMVESLQQPNSLEAQQEQTQEQQASQDPSQAYHNGYDWYDAGGYDESRWYENSYWYYDQNGHPTYTDPNAHGPEYDVPPPPPVPPPPLEDESQMSEKERIRQAEMRLLPSQPPGAEDVGEASGSASAAPTAPYLAEEVAAQPPPPPWQLNTGNHSLPSSSSAQNGDVSAASDSTPIANLPSVPAYEPLATSSSERTAIFAPTDDKQELQRQRLEAEASAPPEEDVTRNHMTNQPDGETHQPLTADAFPTAPVFEPSAPTLAEAGAPDDTERSSGIHENDSHADAHGSAILPRYER